MFLGLAFHQSRVQITYEFVSQFTLFLNLLMNFQICDEIRLLIVLMVNRLATKVDIIGFVIVTLMVDSVTTKMKLIILTRFMFRDRKM